MPALAAEGNRREAGVCRRVSRGIVLQLVLAWKIYLTKGFKVIHACNPPDTIFLVALTFKLFGCNFVFDHHDLCPELYVSKFGRSDLFHRTLLVLERATFWLADKSIVPNESYRKVALGRGGMSSDDVHVVRNAPDISWLQPVTRSARFATRDKITIGYVGIMGPQDGVEGFLTAARILIREMRRDVLHFLLIGDGPALESLRRLARELAIDDRLTFSGFLTGKEYLQAIKCIDIGVSPDLIDEYNDKSMMSKVMEYMALGLPSVQFESTEGRFSAGDASLYARPNDVQDLAAKIAVLADDFELRSKLGEIGRRRIRDGLSWQHEAPKLIQVYRTVCPVRV